MKFMPNILSVGCWNIEGIYQKVNGTRISKLEDETFTNTLQIFDIFCLQETHTSQNDTPTFEKFVTIPHCRKISANKRYFGGMLLFIRRTLRKGMKVNRDIDEDCVEVILDKDFFGLTECVRILFTYASPLTSPYTKSRSRTVLEKIDTHIDNGRTSCLVTGDLNGRTKTDEDFVRDSDDKHSPITDIPLYIRDSQLKRNNRDTHTIDEQGKMILEICKSHSLRILNGRTMGDELRTFTRYPKRINENPSVIDYTLCGEALMPSIFSFSVLPFTEFSDHCSISFFININQILDANIVKVNPNPPKLKFDRDRVRIFQENVRLSEKFEPLVTLTNKPELDKPDLDLCVIKLNDLIIDSAMKTCPVRTRGNAKKKKGKKCWFNKECSKLQRLLRRQCRDLSKHPYDKQKCHLYIKTRNEYKRTCRKAEKNSRNELTKKLFNIGLNDPKGFWNIINKMNNWGKEKADETDQIKPSTWREYFSKLLNDTRDPDDNGLDTPNFVPTFQPTLDRMITMDELRKALSLLKNHKAAGCDRISAEYLKAFAESFGEILLKILQRLFAKKVYPSEWTSNFLKPIYMKGDSTNTDNFRGLAIGAALAKLYSLILLNRLTEYIKKNNLISVNQIGFMTCTSDHIFLLQTIIEKVVKKIRKDYMQYLLTLKRPTTQSIEINSSEDFKVSVSMEYF